MKTKAKLFFAAIFTAVIFFTTSCAFDIVAPKNKWVTYEYPIEYNNDTYVVLCYAYYSDTETTIKTYNNGTLTVPAGLTIVANPQVETGKSTDAFKELFGEFSEDLVNDAYTIKTFKNGEKVEIAKDGENEDSSSFKMSYTTWLILYNSIRNEGVSTGAPQILKGGNTYQEQFQNFKWKKLIYYFAISKLTDLAAAE